MSSIFWEEDDQSLYTGSSDGQVNYWKIDEADSPKIPIWANSKFCVTSVSAVIEKNNEKQNQVKRIVYVAGYPLDESQEYDNKNKTSDPNKDADKLTKSIRIYTVTYDRVAKLLIIHSVR